MKITIKCPKYSATNIKKNEIKYNNKQNYFCKDCRRQFIGDHALSYKGCSSDLINKILTIFVRVDSIRDIAEIEKVSIKKVLSVLVNSNKKITPKQNHYDKIEVDEFWTYVGNK